MAGSISPTLALPRLRERGKSDDPQTSEGRIYMARASARSLRQATHLQLADGDDRAAVAVGDDCVLADVDLRG